MTVSIIKPTCVTPKEAVVGTNLLKKSFTLLSKLIWGFNLYLEKTGFRRTITCTIPPAIAPAASAYIPICSDKKTAETIKDIFRKAGDRAGKKKIPFIFKTAIKKATHTANMIYGKTNLTSFTASSKTGSPTKPGARTAAIYGANKIKKAVRKKRITDISVKIESIKLSGFFPSLSILLYIGIKTALRLPSPKTCLNVFGSLHAIKKASVKILAPNM